MGVHVNTIEQYMKFNENPFTDISLNKMAVSVIRWCSVGVSD